MTAAQKAAKANFKKAIEYRKKTGVSLKEAFAHVYGKKVGAAPKKKATKKAAPKKAAKKVVKKAAPKKAAKKVAKKVYGTKKRKPIKEQAILNKIHKVKDQVNQLDELQHKHMSISGMQSVAIGNVKYLFEQITKAERQFQILKDRKKRDKKLVGFDAKLFQRYPGYIRSLKKQLSEAKKNIK
jgi:hypothetical protein